MIKLQSGGNIPRESSKHTFLALVEDGRARVVDADLVLVGVRLAAALVNAFQSHDGRGKDEWNRPRWEAKRVFVYNQGTWRRLEVSGGQVSFVGSAG